MSGGRQAPHLIIQECAVSKKDPKGDVRTRASTNSNPTSDTSSRDATTASALVSSTPAASRGSGLDESMSFLLQRDDGWLRVVPHNFGQVTYWKWKFARGPHRGTYVMFRLDYFDWVAGLQGLAEKVREVDEGRRKPALDVPYNE